MSRNYWKTYYVDQSQEKAENRISRPRKIEIFTAGCPLCRETVTAVKQAVVRCGCDVVEHNISTRISREAQRYGVKALPPIVIDGQIVFEGKPTDQQIASLTRNP